MAQFPPQVEAFHQAIERLRSVHEVATGIKLLTDYPPNTYSLPHEYGDLPHALLRRTKGGLKHEMWVYTDFELIPDEHGWIALEFIAWWVRDCSRGGQQIQLRPMALPPMASPDQVQLGTQLRFLIDRFILCPKGDFTPALEQMQKDADFLNQCLDTYREALGDALAR
jgi:hypothetical protein